MSEPSAKFRLTITFKLLGWCLLLSAGFYVVIILLISRVKDVETFTNGIVGVNYRIVENSEVMATKLLGLIESKRRYEILGKEEHRRAYLQNLAEYEERLRELAKLTHSPWQGLHASLMAKLPRGARVALGQEAPPPEETPPPEAEPPLENGRQPKGQLRREVRPADSEGLFLADDVVNGWLATLGEVRQVNRRQMQQSLTDLEQMVSRAERAGNTGLMVALAFGLAGSGLIAYNLSRGLRELRKGIREAKAGRFEPLRVLTGDELGDLAEAFNRMTEQLRAEEQMRADFISMLSHEIRTPLTSVREAVNMIKQGLLGPVNPKQQRFLEISGREAERLSSLLSRLMQVSSMEARDLVLSMQPMDSRQLVNETVERVRASAELKGILIDTAFATLGPTEGRINADAENIRQVLLNLLGNAVKFSPPGSTVTVRVTLEPGLDRLVFCVEDQGPGIPEQEQPFVFRKYYRGTGTRNSVDGAGLGLSISKRIVEAHGGEMWVKSITGQGSAFCFALSMLRGESA